MVQCPNDTMSIIHARWIDVVGSYDGNYPTVANYITILKFILETYMFSATSQMVKGTDNYPVILKRDCFSIAWDINTEGSKIIRIVFHDTQSEVPLAYFEFCNDHLVWNCTKAMLPDGVSYHSPMRLDILRFFEVFPDTIDDSMVKLARYTN